MNASQHTTETVERPADRPRRDIESLTRREREILSLIAAGWSNEGIREALVLSPKTVECHVHNIFSKLDVRRGTTVHSRVMAARIWIGRQREAA